MRIGGFTVCQPFYEMNTDPAVSVTVQTTEPAPEPQPQPQPEPENKEMEIGLKLGALEAKVTALESSNQELRQEVEAMKSEDRWTDERLRNLWDEMYRTQQQVAEIQTEEVTEEITETGDQIPAIPPQVELQEEPKEERKSLFDLKRWI